MPTTSKSDMNDECRLDIERILEPISSINELDQGSLCELRCTSAGRFAVEKFEISEMKFCQWIEENWNDDERGAEYNAQQNSLIIKAIPSELHETSAAVTLSWFGSVATQLEDATGSDFQSIGSSYSDLSGRHGGSRKEPDGGIRRNADDYPLVVLEIAVSESKSDVFRDANRWLEYFSGQTKLAIAVDIRECPVPEEGGTKTTTTTWGLSDEEILRLTYLDLGGHILQWHQQEKIPLLGKFQAFVYFCFPENEPRWVGECAVSLDGGESPFSLMRDTCSFAAQDLLPGLEGALEFSLPPDTLARKMQRSLRVYAAQRARMRARAKLRGLKKTGGASQPSEAK